VTELVTITEPVYQVVGVPGPTVVLSTPEAVVIRTTQDPGIAVDVSPGPPTVLEVGTIVQVDTGGSSNVNVAEGPPTSVAAGALYIELSGGVVNELWTA
jgi:hypothetical protein